MNEVCLFGCCGVLIMPLIPGGTSTNAANHGEEDKVTTVAHLVSSKVDTREHLVFVK